MTSRALATRRPGQAAMTLAAMVLAACLARPTTVRAQALPSPEAAPRLQGELLAHFGLATAPFEVPALREAKGQALVFIASAVYAPSRERQDWQGELQLPWVLGSVAQPAGSYVDASALGNPQVGIRRRLVQQASDDAVFALVAGAKVGVPLARSAEDLMPNRLLAVADGLEGHRHRELFTPGALPFTPSATVAHEGGRWQLFGDLALPLLVRLSGAHLDDHGATTRKLGLATGLGAEARYRLSRRLSLAAAAHLIVELAALTTRPASVSRWQDLECLGLHVRLGSLAALIIDLQAPFGGALGGNTVAAGARVVLDLP